MFKFLFYLVVFVLGDYLHDKPARNVMNVAIEHDILVIRRCHALRALHSNPTECPPAVPHQALSLSGLCPKWVRYFLPLGDFPHWPV